MWSICVWLIKDFIWTFYPEEHTIFVSFFHLSFVPRFLFIKLKINKSIFTDAGRTESKLVDFICKYTVARFFTYIETSFWWWSVSTGICWMFTYSRQIPNNVRKGHRWFFFWFVSLVFIVQLENFSLIWRRHHCRWRAANFDLCSALMAIEQCGFFNVPHPLRHGPTVYNGHLRGPVTFTPVAERLAMKLSQPVFTT